MKNLIKILIICSFISCKAQTIENYEGKCAGYNSNTYYNDINNRLNHYEGTWKYQNGNEILLIKLRKVLNTRTNGSTEDILIGEYKYIDNAGVEKTNTLSVFNTNNTDQTFHAIYVHCIDNFSKPVCDICDPNIKRVLGMFRDPNKDVAGSMYMGKTMVGGDEAIRMFLRTESTVPIVDSDGIAIDFQYVGFTIPMGWYTLIKQ